MSNRDSLGFGDLLPQDVVDIFAQEKHSRRGQKKRSRSLGRALGWLKGKKRKDLGGKGQSPGLGPALDLALDGHPAGHQGGHKGGQRSGRQNYPQGNSHAIPKLDDDDKTPAPPLFQENVFIEASRPKYLENLHSEAQEGLKMMQQEETNNGVEYRDNESTISTVTVQTDGEGGGFVTDSTIGDTTSVVSVQSSVSTRSSRSGLTRQGSTFRPLNSGKKSEKAKIRRRHRKTVAGIPQHVQMELGLDRGGWKATKTLDEEQLYNGETDDSLTNDGSQQAPQKGASARLHDTNAIQPLNKDQLEQLSDTYAGHRDDMALLHCLVPDLSGEQRPRSLAVPWMTTANSLQQEPPSPVMSMSPQAAYMSKIIPNAVLPPSIDVVEISRGRSRNSVRTVSKTSLLLSSPAPSRASSRASSSRTTSSRASTITSASRNKPPNLSDSSCWSNSESSETLVSDSSTISSSSTPKQKRSQDRDGPTKEDKNTVQSSIGKKTKSTSNGKVIITEDLVKKEGSFVRSLSVMKPKRAPPPPNRSYSLHGKMKRRSRDLAEVTVISGEASGEENGKNKSGSSPMPSVIIESPGYSADTSSLEDSTGSVSFSPLRSQLQALNAKEAAKVVETVSKDASEEKQKLLRDNKLNKTVSPSSGYSSQDGTSTQLPKQPYSSSPRHKRGLLAKLQRFFPGSTAATTPPPLTNPEALENIKSTEDLKPDTSVDTASVSPSVRTLIDLFNIPPPPKVHAPPPPPPEVWAHSKRSIELLLGPPVPDNTHAIIKKNPKDRRQQRKSPSTFADGSVQSLVTERKHKNPTVTVESVNGSLHVLEPKKVKESGILNVEIHKEKNDRLAEQNVDLKGNRIVTEKDEKVRVSDILNGMLAKAVERREERLTPLREEEAKKTLTHTTDNMDTLTAISLQRILPSPSPPVHNPPKPPTKQTTEFTSVPSAQVVSPELSWPPPPPPTGMSAADEMDFPLPPPPVFSEEELVLPVQVPPETTISSGDSLCTTTSVVSVVKTQCVRVTTEAEPQKPSTSQGNVHKPLYIPPPPSYTAPPPPTKAVSPLTIIKVSPLQPEEVSPPPPPKEVSLPPPKEHPPPLPKEVPPSPPKEVSPPPPKELSPPPKEVFPPPPEEVPPPPCEEISPPLPKEVSPLPSEDVSLRPPKEFSLPPPKEVSPPPKQVSPVKPKESAPLLIQAPLPSVKDVSSTLVTVVSPSPVKEVSPLPPQEVTTLSTEEVSPPSSQENAHQSPEEATTVIKLTPPQSIPPPPPLMSQPQSSETDLPLENVPAESETSPVSSNSILTPPQSVPPPPPIQLLHQPQVSSPNTDGLVTQEAHHSPPSEVSIHSALENSLPPEKARDPLPSPPVNISLPPPLPVQGLASIKLQPSPASTENQPPELTSAPVVQEEPTPIVTPSLLQMVKLRSVSSSPELPKAQEHPETEVTMGTQQPSNQIPTSSLSGEAPQKPIRKSLIMTSATSTSPPAIITSQPSLPTSQSIVVQPASSSTVLSPTKKSPPVMTASPSMNLQEAIRLRTAARSLGPTASRLSLHSPTSPTDLHKSPTNTASFIFSKSNKKVVIETKPAPETNTTIHRNLEVFSGTKGLCEGESVKKEVKVPPPVAKKPKTKGKEIETSEGTEQTAGQEALQESVMDAAEKSNGTAGTVEGGGTPST